MSVDITKLAVSQLNRKMLLSKESEVVATQAIGTGVMARRGASPKPTPPEDTANPALVLRDIVRNGFKKRKEQQAIEKITKET